MYQLEEKKSIYRALGQYRGVHLQFVLFFLLLFYVSFSFATPKETSAFFSNVEDNKKSIISYIDKIHMESELPGIAVTLFTSEGTILQHIVGVKKLGENNKLVESDLMHLGSNTKAITGMVAARLIERGLLTWDIKLIDVLPEIKGSIHDGLKDVSLFSLLNHTSGLAGKTGGLSWKECVSDGENLVSSVVRRSYTQCITKNKPEKFKKYLYSNAGYIVAAGMLETITNETWETLVAKEVCKPLNINCVYGWPAKLSIKQTYGHNNGILWGYNPQSPNDYSLPLEFAPAGDVSMSTVDYSQWVSEFLRGIKKESTLVSESAFNKLLYSGIGHKRPGFGWLSYVNREGYTLSTHDGSAGPFYVKAVIIKELDLGFTILFNSDSEEEVKKLEKFILEVIFNQ
jgi:CubicO group peptidase (beta-lactamase class C family)